MAPMKAMKALKATTDDAPAASGAEAATAAAPTKAMKAMKAALAPKNKKEGLAPKSKAMKKVAGGVGKTAKLYSAAARIKAFLEVQKEDDGDVSAPTGARGRQGPKGRNKPVVNKCPLHKSLCGWAMMCGYGTEQHGVR